jgi:hypothetical protein
VSQGFCPKPSDQHQCENTDETQHQLPPIAIVGFTETGTDARCVNTEIF